MHLSRSFGGGILDIRPGVEIAGDLPALRLRIPRGFLSQPHRLIDIPDLFQNHNAVRHVHSIDAGWLGGRLVRQPHNSSLPDVPRRSNRLPLLPQLLKQNPRTNIKDVIWVLLLLFLTY